MQGAQTWFALGFMAEAASGSSTKISNTGRGMLDMQASIEARRQKMRQPGCVAIAAALGAVAAAFALTGCGSFFNPKTTGTTSPTSTGDYLYVANANTSLDTVAGFSLASGALTATASSPYQLAVEPSTLAINPANSILYVGSELGGIYAYLIGSTGGLTLSGSGAAASASPAAMIVDASGQYLLVLQYGTSNPSISAFPIDTTTGALSNATSTVTLDQGTAGSLLQIPGSTLIYATLGTGGVDVLTFDSSTGTLTKQSLHLTPLLSDYADQRLASNPAGTLLFVTETGTNGVRSFTINASTGALNQIASTPTGLGVGPVLVDSTGNFLYVANSAANTISAFTISSTGAMTAISGSPFSTGTTPSGLVEDKSEGYLAVTCSGGTPDLELFPITSGTGVLGAATIKQSTGSVSPAGAAAVVATLPTS
jgi:6-phosphogluconolactonase (cycloisomerase 2 family)